jgi:hypothetical protein
VQYLENYLAQGENGLLSKDSQHSNVGGAEQVHRPVLYAANIAFGSVCTTSVLQNNPGIHYAARLFYASERPPLKIPVRGVYNEEPPRMASRGAIFRLSETGARTIPIKVAEKLFENYLKNVLPRYPCFLESDLVYQFNIFYRDTNISETPSSDSTCFIVSMILAISSLTSKSHEFWKVASLSEALQRDALNHATFLGRTSFRSLQCFLLLIQLSLWLPYTANLWYMSGEAMRMAIALGLHQDMDDPSIFDPTQLSLRRNVFWTV